ncbi:hypothetical protein P8452_38675 [Trifolium repens]|nr:hypothetical protein P8452_38675 [Trifolium repens]
MRTMSPEEWAAILSRAKQKKTQEGGEDPTAALVVQDAASSKGTKRRRKMGATKPAKHLKTGPALVSLSVDKGLDKGESVQVEVARDDGVSHTLTGNDVPLPPPSPSSMAPGEVNRSGGVIPPSPFGDTFDPEEFIKSNFVLEGNLDRFDSMGVQDIRRLALGYEFKGLMLNYFLSARQEKDAEAASKKFDDRLDEMTQKMERSHAIYVEELMENHRVALEKARTTCESRIEALKKVYAQDHLTLEGKLRASERNGRNLVKGRNALIVALAMAEDDAAGFEDEVVELEESNNALKDAMGEKYAEGFAAALDQVNVLFPDLDEAVLSQVDLLKFVEDGKLVSRIPEAEPVGISGPELILAAKEDDGLSPSLEKNSGEVVSGAET